MANQRTVITGGTVVTPDVVLADTNVEISGGVITAVGAVEAGGGEVIDASGCYVIPGLVNAHAHGCTTGPLFSSAAPAITDHEAHANADRHLAAGVTTLVNVCGFGLPGDVPEHPLDIRLGSTHLPSAVAAADLVDARGLDATHRAATAAELIEGGAVALGEIGSGATLGGGVAAYRYIPDALKADVGRRLEPEEATALIDALVGPTRVAEPDDNALAAAMAELDLPPEALEVVRKAVVTYASAPVQASLASFAEAVALAERLDVPAVFHVAGPSVRTLLALARESHARLIAGHMNHTSFTPDEAVALARDLRNAHVIIDVSSLDIIHAQHLATPEVADALVREGLVDTLSTDYAGGAWEPMLGVVQRWTQRGWTTLTEGIAMCTSNPAEAMGFTDRGRIDVGMRADIAIVSRDNLEDVHVVVANGHAIKLQ